MQNWSAVATGFLITCPIRSTFGEDPSPSPRRACVTPGRRQPPIQELADQFCSRRKPATADAGCPWDAAARVAAGPQYGAARSGNIGKWRTFMVATGAPIWIALAATR